MKRSLAAIIILIVILGTGASLASGPKILPEMELLAGVLAQTTWINEHGPSGQGNQYFRALKEFFREYSGHEAIILAQEFTKRSFRYDAPPALICHLGPLPELELAYEYSANLVGRAGGRQKLEKFRLALRDLAQETDFLSFFNEWQPYLEASVESSLQGFRQGLLEHWLEDFFGWSPTQFWLIMTPSMFPGGGYGATVKDDKGNPIAFQIIREGGHSQEEPQFPSGIILENLTIHELGHSFVNPSLEAYPDRAEKLRSLLWPVREMMRAQAYNSVATFLNEQVLRAVEVISARDLFTPEIEARILANHEAKGFYLTSFVVKQLEYYQAQRLLYPTFREFAPYLYDQLDLYQKENCTWWERLCGRFLH